MRLKNLIVAALLPLAAYSQNSIEIDGREKWWVLPITEQGNITTPAQGTYTKAMVSSLGRYIYSDEYFEYAFADKTINITSNLKVQKSGKTLRDGSLALLQKMNMNTPVDITLSPVYIAECTAQGIERFLSAADKLSLPKGMIIIKSWQKNTGSLTIGDAQMEALLPKLKDLGYEVILEINPFISGDSQDGIYAADNSLATMASKGLPLIVRHKGGYSLIYDLTKPATVDFFNSRLEKLKDEYGVSGFYFNMTDIAPYTGSAQFYDGKGLSRLAMRMAENIRNVKVANTPISTDIVTSYSAMANGGEAQAVEMELISPYGGIKALIADNISAQEAARLYLAGIFTPSRQIVITDNFADDIEIYKRGEQARIVAEKYIREAIEESRKTGAPVIRHMEYEFPGKGFSNCEDQYMVGSKFLVAPHISNEERMVRLPNGRWKDSKGKVIKGPIVISASHQDIIPYYERVKK